MKTTYEQNHDSSITFVLTSVPIYEKGTTKNMYTNNIFLVAL